MAVPKKKIARSKGKVRYSAFVQKTQKRLQNLNCIIVCKNCGEKKLSHLVCKNCGFFKGSEVISKQAEVTKIQA